MSQKNSLGFLLILFVIFLCASASFGLEWWEEKTAENASRGDKEAADLLVALLRGAIGNGDVSKARDLLKHGANVNALGPGEVTILMAASMPMNDNAENVDMVKVLLDHGADVNAQDSLGNTALTLAVNYGHAEIVKVLLDNGADANLRRKDGPTALLAACQRRSVDMVKMLLEKGADVNEKSYMGDLANLMGMRTALNFAQDAGYSEIVKMLQEKGAK